MCRSRRELSNAYLLAKFGFDTAENEPSKVCPIEPRRVLRVPAGVEDGLEGEGPEGPNVHRPRRVSASSHMGCKKHFMKTRHYQTDI